MEKCTYCARINKVKIDARLMGWPVVTATSDSLPASLPRRGHRVQRSSDASSRVVKAKRIRATTRPRGANASPDDHLALCAARIRSERRADGRGLMMARHHHCFWRVLRTFALVSFEPTAARGCTSSRPPIHKPSGPCQCTPRQPARSSTTARPCDSQFQTRSIGGLKRTRPFHGQRSGQPVRREDPRHR